MTTTNVTTDGAAGAAETPFPTSLSLLAWYRTQGWARRRARRNVDRRRTPAVIVSHPQFGFATVSAASYPRYAELGCVVVDEVIP